MDWFSRVIVQYGGAAMFLFGFAENIGIPFPALPAFVFAGALASRGEASVPLLVAGAVAGAVAADSAWYLMGRWRGLEVLALLCRVTFNPDACVERAETGFHRHKIATILFAKFLPGLNTVMPPMAGIVALPAFRFLLLDAAGSLLWAAAGVGAGFLFGSEVARHATRFNGAVLWAVAIALAGYFLWRVGYRFYLVRYFSVPRIEPEEVHKMMTGGGEVVVLDLRSEVSYASSPATIPGAMRFRPATFRRYVHDLPRGRDIVLFCT